MNLKKKIAFEPHLDSINKAYEDYFKDNREFDFKVLKKPRWKDKSHFKVIKMIIFVLAYTASSLKICFTLFIWVNVTKRSGYIMRISICHSNK